MALCPRCSKKLPGKRVLALFFNSNAIVQCSNCHAEITLNRSKAIPLFAVIITVTSILAAVMASVHSRLALVTVVLFSWIFISGLLFVRFVSLSESSSLKPSKEG